MNILCALTWAILYHTQLYPVRSIYDYICREICGAQTKLNRVTDLLVQLHIGSIWAWGQVWLVEKVLNWESEFHELECEDCHWVILLLFFHSVIVKIKWDEIHLKILEYVLKHSIKVSWVYELFDFYILHYLLLNITHYYS